MNQVIEAKTQKQDFLSTIIHTKSDPTLKDYFRNSERFADLMNVIKFHGEQVLTAEMISPFDTDVSSIVEVNDLYASVNRNRDIIQTVTFNDNHQLLIALENQQTVDRIMPLRVAIYDGLTHLVQEKMKTHDESKIKELNTFVLYYGQYRWNAAKTLQEMMGLRNDQYENLTVWNGQIIDIKDLDVNLFHHPDNIDMITCIQAFYTCKGDYTKIKNFKTSKEVAVVVATVIGNKDFAKLIMEEGGEVNMCDYFDQLVHQAEERGKSHGITEGKAQGKVEGIAEGIVEGMFLVLLRAFKGKLGHLSDDIIIEMKKSDLEHLDELSIQISNVQNEDDILKILSK